MANGSTQYCLDSPTCFLSDRISTSGFRPRLNGATEHVHRFLNSAIGIYCERFQGCWEEYLLPGPFQVTGHPYDHSDLLTLCDIATGETILRPVNIKKVVVVPGQQPGDIRIPDDAILEPDLEPQIQQTANLDLATVGIQFGKYLNSLPNKSAVSSQACKYV